MNRNICKVYKFLFIGKAEHFRNFLLWWGQVNPLYVTSCSTTFDTKYLMQPLFLILKPFNVFYLFYKKDLDSKYKINELCPPHYQINELIC